MCIYIQVISDIFLVFIGHLMIRPISLLVPCSHLFRPSDGESPAPEVPQESLASARCWEGESLLIPRWH